MPAAIYFFTEDLIFVCPSAVILELSFIKKLLNTGACRAPKITTFVRFQVGLYGKFKTLYPLD